jgi:hypothetical protein
VDFDLGFLCLEVLGIFLTVPEMISSRAIFHVSTGGSFRTLLSLMILLYKNGPASKNNLALVASRLSYHK